MPTPAAPKPQCQATFSPSVPQTSGATITRDVHREQEDLEGVGAAQIVRPVKLADLGRDIALEAADAEQEAEQGEQEADLERHQEMAGRHQQRADRDRAGAAEQPIGDAGRRAIGVR